jgi:hypothetical protein
MSTLAMNDVSKTTLTAKSAKDIQSYFDYMNCRTSNEAPTIENFTRLLAYLHESCCLLYWLAMNRETVCPKDLQEYIVPSLAIFEILYILDCLVRRSQHLGIET